MHHSSWDWIREKEYHFPQSTPDASIHAALIWEVQHTANSC